MLGTALKTLALSAAALAVTAAAAAATFFGVFYLPVLLGQPEESMVGWGWVTTLPAVGLGTVVGNSCLAYFAIKIIGPYDQATARERKLRIAILIALAVTIGLVFLRFGFLESLLYLMSLFGARFDA